MFNLTTAPHSDSRERDGRNADGSAVISARFTALLDAEAVQGVYSTSINIHNTQLSSAVQFPKTIAQAFQEGTTSSADAAAPRLCPLTITLRPPGTPAVCRYRADRAG